jgi:hypothetical protein
MIKIFLVTYLLMPFGVMEQGAVLIGTQNECGFCPRPATELCEAFKRQKENTERTPAGSIGIAWSCEARDD